MAAPSTPTNLAVTAGLNELVLTWTASTGTLDNYKIYVGDTSESEVWLADTVGSVTVTYTHTPLLDGVTKFYKVSAIFGTEESGLSNEDYGTTYSLPGAPTGLIALGGLNEIDLAWTAPASTGGVAIDYYNVYVGTVVIGTAAFLTYYDLLLGDGVSKTYTVSAVNVVGEGAASPSANATTFDVPDAPTALAVGRGIYELYLTWVEPVGMGGTPLTEYRIYTQSGTLLLATVGTTVLAYTATGLGDGVTEDYEVSAVNIVGEGVHSTGSEATTWNVPSVPQNLTAVGGVRVINLAWDAPASDGGTSLLSYNIYTEVGGISNIQGSTAAGVRTYADNYDGLGNGQTRYYHVSAINGAGESVQTGTESGTTFSLPGVPTGLTLEPGDGQVYISTWVAPVSTGGSAITGYKIYRGTTALVITTLVNTVSATIAPYLNSGLTNGVTYYYKISAVTAVGEGAKSAEAHGLVTAAPVTLTNQYLYNAESLREFVYDLSGSSSYILPIPTNFLVLAIIPSFASETNIVASTRIIADKSAKTVEVIDAAGSPSPLEFNLNVIVFCRDKLFQNDN
jgi:hypothetical protein